MKIASILVGLMFFGTSFCNGTINIQIKTPGYIVFASDGRVMLVTDSGETNSIVTDTHEKIYKFNKYIMVQSGGVSNPCGKNLKTTFEDLKWQYDIEDTASIFIDSLILLYQHYCKNNSSKGCDYGDNILLFVGPDFNGNLQLKRYTPKLDVLDTIKRNNIYYSGTETFCTRLFEGIDGVLKEILTKKVVGDTTELAQNMERIINSFSAWESQKTHLLSINDAINIAYNLVEITMLMDDLFSGRMTKLIDRRTPKTGGRITICVVTREGVQWILEPKLFDSEVELRQLENE